MKLTDDIANDFEADQESIDRSSCATTRKSTLSLVVTRRSACSSTATLLATTQAINALEPGTSDASGNNMRPNVKIARSTDDV